MVQFQATDLIVADTTGPLALYESGFAPHEYIPRADIDESALTPVEHPTFCPYKGLYSYSAVHRSGYAFTQIRTAPALREAKYGLVRKCATAASALSKIAAKLGRLQGEESQRLAHGSTRHTPASYAGRLVSFCYGGWVSRKANVNLARLRSRWY